MRCAALASKEDSTGKNYREHKPTAVTDNLRSRQLFGNSHTRSMPKAFEHFAMSKIKLKYERAKAMEREQKLSAMGRLESG